MTELFGRKIGMTQIFTEQGTRCAVTVIETEFPGDAKSDSDLFRVGDFIDIIGTSKGRGFQGGMKRFNWSGTPKTHGSMSHRRVGSIGASASPSRVLKGQHMPGHMGNERVTVQNLRIIKIDNENKLLVVSGAVPGHRNSEVIIRKAKKKPTKAEVKAEAEKKEVKAEPEKKEVKAEVKIKPEKGEVKAEVKTKEAEPKKEETKSEVKAEVKKKEAKKEESKKKEA
jgi:hypothetical protein